AAPASLRAAAPAGEIFRRVGGKARFPPFGLLSVISTCARFQGERPMKPFLTPIGLALAAALAVGVSGSAAAQRAQPTPIGEGPWDLETETGTVHVSVLTSDLQSPWSLV